MQSEEMYHFPSIFLYLKETPDSSALTTHSTPGMELLFPGT